jgi:hypothetical protein
MRCVIENGSVPYKVLPETGHLWFRKENLQSALSENQSVDKCSTLCFQRRGWHSDNTFGLYSGGTRLESSLGRRLP